MPWTGGVGKGLKRKAKLLRWKTFFSPRLSSSPRQEEGGGGCRFCFRKTTARKCPKKIEKCHRAEKNYSISPFVETFVFFFTLSALSLLSAPQSSKCTKGLYYMVILRVGCHPGTKKARQKTI